MDSGQSAGGTTAVLAKAPQQELCHPVVFLRCSCGAEGVGGVLLPAGVVEVFLFFSLRFRCWESPPPPGPHARPAPSCALRLMTALEEVWCEMCFLRQAAPRVKSLPAAAAAGAEQLKQTQCETSLFLAVDQRAHI